MGNGRSRVCLHVQCPQANRPVGAQAQVMRSRFVHAQRHAAAALDGRDRRLFLEDLRGNRVGALSDAASQRWRPLLPQIRSVRVTAVVIRRSEDEGEDYRSGLRRDAWSVVIPEVRYDVAQA